MDIVASAVLFVITLWGFLWRSFISNIEWWCSVLTRASAAVVWHAFPLELPRLESVGGNLSGCWRPWWKTWIVIARKTSEWEELPDLSGIRPCLMFSLLVFLWNHAKCSGKTHGKFPRDGCSLWNCSSLELWLQLLAQRSSDALACTERKIAQVKPRCVASLRWMICCAFFSFVCLFYVDTNGRAA